MEEKSINYSEIVNIIRSMEREDEQFYFFLRSCENSNLQLCQACLDAGININIRNHPHEETILEGFCLSKKFNIEIAKWLLDKGAYPKKTKSLYGPLTILCKKGNLEGAKLLYERGATVTTRNKLYTGSDLYWAVEKGNYEIVKWLIELGVNLEYKATIDNPFYTALENRRSDIVELFLKGGVPCDCRLDKKCLTPLHIAVWYKDKKTATILLENGANVNANIKGSYIFRKDDNDVAITPMDIAIVNRDSDMQKILSKFGGISSTKDEKIKAIFEVNEGCSDINIKAIMKKIME